MDVSELAAAAVGDLVSGTAAALGESGGSALAETVRARLSGSSCGRAALSALDADVGDTAAQEEARDVLREELEGDPALRRELLVHFSSSRVDNRESVVITGSRVSRSHISVGPLTINNTPGARILIAALVLLTCALIALTVYGGWHLVIADSPDRSSSQPAERRSTADQGSGSLPGSQMLSAEDTDRALPTEDSMPKGWYLFDDDVFDPEDRPEGCRPDGVTFEQWTSEGMERVSTFTVYACPSADAAASVFRQAAPRLAEERGFGPATSLAVPRLGDESAAVWHKWSRTEGDAVATTRVGNVVLRLWAQAYSEKDSAVLSDLIRRAVERIQTVQSGKL
ncbi:hypothetical protein ABT218_23860 [Streptomyces sp. NPDC001455]|uniref:hypothetical protein n=1 Tax=Streptomyces sp. NPDC001455 TaxID=3154518 RepID=UPI00332BD6CB